jgi:hypothetical protein
MHDLASSTGLGWLFLRLFGGTPGTLLLACSAGLSGLFLRLFFLNSLLCLFFFLFGTYSTFLLACSAGLGGFFFSAHGACSFPGSAGLCRFLIPRSN